MSKRLYLAAPHMSEEGYEQEYVREAFETNWVAPLGKNVDMFERELSNHVGAQSAAALVSGTSAIHLALKNVGVEAGDVVFCQSLTFSASANPILYEKAIPVFIDSERETWNMDPQLLEQAFAKYTPKAVIVVHLYGMSAKIDEIKEICQKYNTPLIEDAAESLGTLYKEKWTGTFGDYGIFSFNGNKIITTSGGGMLVSNNEKGIEKAKFWATQSRDNAPYYQHSEVGYNYRLSNVSAGIGRGQLKVLDKRVIQKRAIWQWYRDALKDIEEIDFVQERDDEYANRWLTTILINSDTIKPIDIIESLAKEDIESRYVWKPLHLQPIFEQYDYVGTGVSDEIFRRGLCLPSDSKMTQADVYRVVEIIKRHWRN